MTNKKYVARVGCPYSDTDADVIGKEMDRLTETTKKITPRELVESAKNPTSPLHQYFDWDVESAAYKHWLSTARQIMASVMVIYESNEEPIRAYYRVISESGDGSYVALPTVLTEEDYLRQIIKQALDELKGWKKRYGQYKELKRVVNENEVDKLDKKFKS